MTQEIVALILVFIAIAYTVFNIVKLFTNKEETACNCGGCDIKAEIHKLKSIKRI